MTAVDGILYSKDMSRLICYPPSKTGSDFTIPNSVTSIDDYSFGANKYLRKLILMIILRNFQNISYMEQIIVAVLHTLSYLIKLR